jgi:hypothetical protein
MVHRLQKCLRTAFATMLNELESPVLASCKAITVSFLGKRDITLQRWGTLAGSFTARHQMRCIRDNLQSLILQSRI